MLTGKVAVITGASKGIGRAIALAFARDGADVVLVARNHELLDQVAEEVKGVGQRALPVVADVALEEDSERVVQGALSRFGNIDILVNNAGVTSSSEMAVWETTVGEWDRVMNTNLRGTFLFTRAVISHMVGRRTGAIVNIASVSAHMPQSSQGAYCTSKWALLGYTRCLATSVRPHGIRVNAISPGWVETDMAGHRLPRETSDWSTADQIAEVALFLVSRAPPDMTGQSIDVFENGRALG